MDVVATVLGSAAVGFLLALLLEGMKDGFVRLWRGPKIELSFSKPSAGQTNEYVTRTVELIEQWGLIAEPDQNARRVRIASAKNPAHYIRIKVRNTKQRTAETCRGFLVGITQADGSPLVPTAFSDSIPLKWSYLPEEAPHAVDIPTGIPQYLNLIRTREGLDGFQFDVTSWPIRYEEVLTNQETYLLKVAVTAVGAVTETIEINFTWSGSWDRFTVG